MIRKIYSIIILVAFLNGTESFAQTLPEKSPTRSGVFIHSDKMPEFPGGKTAMMKFISDNIKYPEEAAMSNSEGKVLLSVVIDKYGKPRDIISKSQTNKSLENEAIRVVKLMPDWKPGMQNDSVVSVQVMIPVMFKLTNK